MDWLCDMCQATNFGRWALPYALLQVMSCQSDRHEVIDWQAHTNPRSDDCQMHCRCSKDSSCSTSSRGMLLCQRKCGEGHSKAVAICQSDPHDRSPPPCAGGWNATSAARRAPQTPGAWPSTSTSRPPC